MSWLRALLAAFIAACPFVAVAQYPADTRQGIFHPAFKTLQVQVDGFPMAPPVVSLGNASDRIVISFDELADDRRYMRYELIHCNSVWKPEGLVDSEFLDGFNRGDVEIYEYSRATTVHYVHYTVVIPNEQMRPLVSGNYLVRFYPEDNPDETLLQARFSVSDDTMSVSGDVTTRTDIDTNETHQQVELSVDTRDVAIDDIWSDLTVVVTQNGRLDNEIVISRPLRVSGRTAIYEHQRPLIFDAGNEYRRMEIVSTTYPGMHVGEILWADPLYHFVLQPDMPRATEPYIFDRTQNGRFKIREYNSSDSDVEADYALVHFSLVTDQIDGADIFLDGDFTNRRLEQDSRMVYNRGTGAYEATVLLKQGAYNYQYLTFPVGGTRQSGQGGATGPVEGNFSDTVNEYTVKVYYRPRGTRYDRLGGVTTIYSQK